jgi:phosphatidylserine decarboxylase
MNDESRAANGGGSRHGESASGAAGASGGGFRERLFVWFQYLLPQHGLSRLILAATRVRTAWFKNWTIRCFLELYRVDMTEAAESDPYRHGSFNEFFTRALKAGVRPIASDPAIASPVDGCVSEAGTIDHGRLLQAKGRDYGLTELLAAQPWASRFEGGSFATIYLAPFNYHRVHMPLRGELKETVYVPGRLFSVNAVTARHVPGLFARNERVLTLFDSGAMGEFALVLVGALNVGSMATVWAGDITPAARRVVTRIPGPPTTLEKGAELGRFNMGSTVILLFEPNRVRWHREVHAGSVVRLGQSLGAVS